LREKLFSSVALDEQWKHATCRHDGISNFVAAADAAGVNVMMDEPFDHTAHDCELDN
jgi:hypothetical protein